MSAKSSSYRFNQATADRIEKLSERGEQSRTQVIEDAVYNLALGEGILHEEANERFADMLGRHGDDAVITFATVPNSPHVPASINGEPTQEIRGHRIVSSAAFTVGTEEPTIDPNAEQTTIAVIPKSGISFDLGRVKAPEKLEMKLPELFERMRPFQPRTSGSTFLARALGRAAGLRDDEDE